jgi:periplasmic protein TonB
MRFIVTGHKAARVQERRIPMNRLAFASASPLYQPASTKKLRPSVMAGLGLALGLHLLLIAYLITQTIAPIIDPTDISVDPPTPGAFVTMAPKNPEMPKPVINLHRPENPVVTQTPPLPVPPADNTVKTVAGPEIPALPTGGEVQVAGGSEAPAGPVAVAKWSRFPGPEALSTYYPPRALEAEVEGVSTLECVVRDVQGHVTCSVLSERPGGYGFGEATRRMIEKVGRVEVNTGGMAVGSALRLSVKWSLPQ